MNTTTIDRDLDQTTPLYANPREQLLPNASPALRNAALLLVHVWGCTLMLSAPLISVAAAGTALYLGYQALGPLDGFLALVLAVISVVSARLSARLFTLRPAPPAGVQVDPQQAPELMGMLARRSKHFKVKPPAQVLLTTETELLVVATPVKAFPVCHQYHLCVGAPLLFFLDREQFGLALAAAVAASARRQSQLTGWLDQACDDWPQIIEALEQTEEVLARLLVGPLQHVNRTAARLGSTLNTDWRREQAHWLLDHSDEQKTSNYLASQIVASTFLDRQYWPMILKTAERCPTPVVKAFSHLPLLLDRTLTDELAARWLLQARSATDRYFADTRDLLAELQLDELPWSGLPGPGAFKLMFGYGAVLKRLDSLWQQEVEPEWRRCHSDFQRDRLRFEQLQKRAAGTGLRDESALRYIDLAPRFLDQTDTLAAYRKVYATNRDDARVCFAAGTAMLDVGDNRQGYKALQRAADIDPSLAERARALIEEHSSAWVHQHAGSDPGATRQAFA
ncbi:MAG: hypothetical protein PVJ83_05500 [Gammaproteobacteria bacterium]|jgi:hypothetical protein